MIYILYGVLVYLLIGLIFGLLMFWSAMGDPKFGGLSGALVFGLMCGLGWPFFVFLFLGNK
jgi:hypothetical protein